MAGIVRIVTVREVAEFLRLKEATICRLASEGKLPGVKVGKSWRFDMEALERWITGAQTGVIGERRDSGVREVRDERG